MRRVTTKIRVMVAALGFLGGLPLISTNLFAQEVPPTRVPVGPPALFSPENYSLPHAAVPAVRPQSAANGGVQISFSYDGIDANGSNCGCAPPDSNAAVSSSFVLETVNVQLRVFDKHTGIVLLDEPLATLFRAPSRGDTYAVYDDIADRWYISAFDGNDSGLFLAVSVDGNPLHGFQTFHLTNVGGSPDYPKPGFNEDAIFISYNAFGSNGGNAAIASIDKAAAVSGTLTYFVSHPKSQFRAMPPAQMHGDKKGGVEWFVSTDGTDAGGNTIRVTEMTNYLSNTPNFTYTSPVMQYQYAQKADQPGGNITVFPNTTTTQVHYHLGRLVTAMASATASDGFVYPKGLYYQINVNGGRPRLLKQGVIDPGPGVRSRCRVWSR